MKAQGRYKVVELGTVTDVSIEEALNYWVSEGWVLDSMHFAMRESSKRPGMAFILFTRRIEERSGEELSTDSRE